MYALQTSTTVLTSILYFLHLTVLIFGNFRFNFIN